ncbi:receptor-like cytosolic serine/threonine-protein kinase RBK1 isoform X1 [Cucurbita pepo subsp. pepo]|uniref:receptor-like cytosolic serine/threonine-protein kinase RBK1 isoform X1 n=1 Tax=Cucurbita pepo subsp. pepo TaxID=3664 RepID=UPI000C9D2C96|nr:receptor-like cytosolic serine/threonine-protein kinase RBK1 isoform X1 [Cucurbita pepo subsp. pepo]
MTVPVEIKNQLEKFLEMEMEMEMELGKEMEEMGGEGGMKIKGVEGYPCDENSPRGVFEIPIMGTDSDQSESSSGGGGDGDAGGSPTAAEKALIPAALLQEIGGIPWRTMIGSIKKKTIWRFSTFPLLAAGYELSRKNFKRKLARIRSADEGITSDDIPFCKPSWRNYGFSELAIATNNFSPENLLGKGGQAEVYKGCFADGQVVAVKRLMKKEKENEERTADFLSELGIIAHINHPNAARLLGFGIDGGLYLVLEFVPYGSFASSLFGAESLPWKIRFKVAVGVAEGLNYLHRECPRRIIHRDIKASNILLDENYEPLISDFGLAKWLPENWAHHVVFPIEGTFGYLAPEYFMHGIVDEKTDVFAYGVLLLELITGRHAVDSSRQSLVIWAKPLLDSSSFKELTDPKLGDDYDQTEMKRTMLAASMCINHTSSLRPHMNRVVQLLKGEDGPVDQLKQKSLNGDRSLLLEACDLEDYTINSTYLKDLTRHRELALG